MKKFEIMNTVSRGLHKAGFQVKKHSPEILLTTGIVGVVGSAVMACKATTKVSAILEETKENIDVVHAGMEEGEINGVEYTQEDGKKDLAIMYAQTGLKLVKLYGPALVLGTASIGCILASNNIIRKRNAALAAAYSAIDSSFKGYRSRVIERFGEDLDRELKYNIKAKEVEEIVVDENGKETTVKKTVEYADPNLNSDYAKFFDEACAGWSKSPEDNLYFLRCQQNWANDRLKAKGHLFLNEVYDMLDIPRTKAGNVVGWVYDDKNPIGDNYVDFGIYDKDNPAKRRFVNGDERNILLDFNVDGPIWDLLS